MKAHHKAFLSKYKAPIIIGVLITILGSVGLGVLGWTRDKIVDGLESNAKRRRQIFINKHEIQKMKQDIDAIKKKLRME